MSDKLIERLEELIGAFFRAKGSLKKLEAVCREAMNLVESLTAKLGERDAEIERLKGLLGWCADSMNKHSELDEAAEEGQGCAAEVLAAIQKQETA